MLQNSKPISQETLTVLQNLIASAKWRNTKTYPDHMAHSYILRVDFPQVYDELKKIIAECGFDSQFYKETYRYVIIDNHKYWAFDTLVNREVLEKSVAREGKPELGG